jgi:hypothetical protein
MGPSSGGLSAVDSARLPEIQAALGGAIESVSALP